MTQLSLIEPIINKIISKINNGIENIKENNIQINESNGIVEVKYGNEIYKTWTINLIMPLIIKFLNEKYPDSLILPELNKIDLVVINKKIDEIIPVEIQKTILCKTSFSHTHFENAIRKQLEDNIENYEKCWFFFDSEYLRYLQYKDIPTTISMNMTWLVKLMKEETLKVFVIKYDGIVKELTTKDFDFLKKISQTCTFSYDNDERVLNRNKLKIYRNVILGNKFTQEEVDSFYIEFNNNKTSEERCGRHFTKSNNERCKLYGHILDSIGNLKKINDILNMNSNSNERNDKFYTSFIGILDIVGTHNHGSNVKFVDKFDVCNYFPGYVRNKEQWESYRNTNLTHSTFVQIINGTYKKQHSLFDYQD